MRSSASRAKTRTLCAWQPFVTHCFVPVMRSSAARVRMRRGVRARAGLGERERRQLVALGQRRHEALGLLARAVGRDRQRPGARVDGEGDPEAGVAARDLLDDEDVGEEVRARAAELLGHADAHEPELAELVGDLAREAPLAVPVGGARCDDLVGEAPCEVADLPLLVGEVVEHQRARR